jgi:hypothetical protein
MVELKTLEQIQMDSCIKSKNNSGVFMMYHNTRENVIKIIKALRKYRQKGVFCLICSGSCKARSIKKIREHDSYLMYQGDSEDGETDFTGSIRLLKFYFKITEEDLK